MNDARPSCWKIVQQKTSLLYTSRFGRFRKYVTRTDVSNVCTNDYILLVYIVTSYVAGALMDKSGIFMENIETKTLENL